MKNIIKKFNKNLGFTLIELLVVIAIVGLLSTLAIASFRTARLKSCAQGNTDVCSGDMAPTDAKERLGDTFEPVEKFDTTKKCDKELAFCRYSCALDKENSIDDCLLRCNLINEYCLNKK